jgi:hypothetical protein
MKIKGFTSIVVVVVALHLAAWGFVVGPLRWPYLLSATLSGTLIWGAWSALASRRRRAGLLVGLVVALAAQQIAFRVWRAQFGGVWPPLVQFIALHVLIGLGLDRLRRPGPSRP